MKSWLMIVVGAFMMGGCKYGECDRKSSHIGSASPKLDRESAVQIYLKHACEWFTGEDNACDKDTYYYLADLDNDGVKELLRYDWNVRWKLFSPTIYKIDDGHNLEKVPFQGCRGRPPTFNPDATCYMLPGGAIAWSEENMVPSNETMTVRFRVTSLITWTNMCLKTEARACRVEAYDSEVDRDEDSWYIPSQTKCEGQSFLGCWKDIDCGNYQIALGNAIPVGRVLPNTFTQIRFVEGNMRDSLNRAYRGEVLNDIWVDSAPLGSYYTENGEFEVSAYQKGGAKVPKGVHAMLILYEQRYGKYYRKRIAYCGVPDTGSSGNYSYESFDGRVIFVDDWACHPDGATAYGLYLALKDGYREFELKER